MHKQKTFHEELYRDYNIAIYKDDWYSFVLYDKEGKQVHHKEGSLTFAYALKDAKEQIDIYHIKESLKRIRLEEQLEKLKKESVPSPSTISGERYWDKRNALEKEISHLKQ